MIDTDILRMSTIYLLSYVIHKSM